MAKGVQRLKVLITGTSSGIGKATAERFLQSGHEVVGIDILPPTINHSKYTHFVADVANADSLPDVEGIEILIPNAGTVEEDTAIDVNLRGYINTGEKYAFQETMKAIVLVGSIAARTGLDTLNYCASQGGRVSYAKNLALRVGHWRQIPCNIVSFGATHTSLEQKLYDNDEKYQAVADEALLKKWCYPDEAAEWLYFVATMNKSMTGQNILIDNGEEANYNFIEWR